MNTSSNSLNKEHTFFSPGHQGTGVVSYFVFLKFLLFLNVFIFLTTLSVVVFFQVTFDSTDFTKETTGYDNSTHSPGVILSQNCTDRYHVKKTSGFQLILDLIQGTVCTVQQFVIRYYTILYDIIILLYHSLKTCVIMLPEKFRGSI
jgi:hypothetical protein